ncbi:MAG: Ig-like domain-containing protein, partial [Gemmatimonadota bacterium]|nr:Ig-like domain-containing protein [Gemmatimonadota bacterium]
MQMVSRSILALLLCVLTFGSCDLVTDPGVVAEVEIHGAVPSLVVGEAVQLGAVVRDPSGKELRRHPVSWSSTGDSVATVDAEGLVTARAPGTVAITAAAAGRTASVTLVVSPVPVASVTISPDTAEILVGGSRQLTAILRDAAGNALTERTVVWSSSDTTWANVSSTGLVRGVAPGPVTITAASEGKSATATVTVRPVPIASLAIEPATASILVGGTVQLSVLARDSAGNVLSGRSLTISSSDTTIATVNASKVVTGLTVGTVRITATAEGRSAMATVTVRPVASRIELVPSKNVGAAGTVLDPPIRFRVLDRHGSAV